MNPSPSSPRPFNPPPRLVDTRLPAPGYVAVTVTRGCPATYDYLDAIERQWNTDRLRLASELTAVGEALENAHWDWRNKARRQPHWHTLVTIEYEGQVQGVMASENFLRPSVLMPGSWVLYIDFLEVAPWNHRVPSARDRGVVREPLFRRVGTLLIGEAIRTSMGVAASGRVGLHALPQAEEFYVRQCGMTRVGPDPHYYGLVYFEYSEGVAQRHLTAIGLSA